MATLLEDALLADTLHSLPGWSGDRTGIWREVHLSPEADAELRRQVAVDAQAMGHAPVVEQVEGGTRYTLRTEEAGGVTELDIAFASHLSDLAHRMSGAEPGVDAVRQGDPVVVVRSADAPGGQSGDEAPTIGVGSVTGGSAPRVPLPDAEPYAPEPGVSVEQDPRD